MVSQSYTVNLWEENVLRGNAAILKCHIPSFVTEYVTVTTWIVSEGDTDEMEININSDSNLGNSLLARIPSFARFILPVQCTILYIMPTSQNKRSIRLHPSLQICRSLLMSEVISFRQLANLFLPFPISILYLLQSFHKRTT